MVYERNSPRADAEKREYARRRKSFLAANPWCAWGLLQNPPQQIPATHIHHKRGRSGEYYLDTRWFVAVSQAADKWIHAHEAEAVALGLLLRESSERSVRVWEERGRIAVEFSDGFHPKATSIFRESDIDLHHVSINWVKKAILPGTGDTWKP